jgi:hypothetical protein
MKQISLLLLLLFIINLFFNTGCTSFQRSPGSGYADFNTNRGDMGFRESSLSDLTPAHTMSSAVSPQESESYREQMYRKNLESNLKSPEERSQYLKYKPYMTEADRIDFLQLDDIFARERWAQSKGLSSNPEKYSRTLASLIEQNDIAIGMNKEAVRDSWGDPDLVEVSGNPKFENERWRFSVPTQTPEGYQMEERFVYFESGRVVGWTSR